MKCNWHFAERETNEILIKAIEIILQSSIVYFYEAQNSCKGKSWASLLALTTWIVVCTACAMPDTAAIDNSTKSSADEGFSGKSLSNLKTLLASFNV